jgi:hypothetical protein
MKNSKEEEGEEKEKEKEYKGVIKVISGGQNGADRAGLEAAKKLGIETGGTAAPKYSTSSGKCPSLGTDFNMTCIDLENNNWGQAYARRSMMNVDASDGTIAFRYYKSPGTDNTIGYCVTGKWKYVNITSKKSPPYDAVWIPPKSLTAGKDLYRPVIVVTQLREDVVDVVKEFIKENEIKILNVCGNRGVNYSSWQRNVYSFMLDILKKKKKKKE